MTEKLLTNSMLSIVEPDEMPHRNLFSVCNLAYKLKKIVGSNNFSAQFIKIISHYKKIGSNINVMLGGQPNYGWQLCFPL